MVHFHMLMKTRMRTQHPSKSDVSSDLDVSEVAMNNQYFDYKIMSDGVQAYSDLLQDTDIFYTTPKERRTFVLRKKEIIFRG